MNAIYRTLTGGIECTVEGGDLFVRTVKEGKCPLVRGPWKRSPIGMNSARNLMESGSEKESNRGQCIVACLIDSRDPWFRIANKSDALRTELEACLAAEQADRPEVSK